MTGPFTFPDNADLCYAIGHWWDATTQRGRDETITATPVPATGDTATPAGQTPNLRDIAARGRIKTGAWVARPNAATGYYAFPVVANNDPDLDAYGGLELAFGKEAPFLIEVDAAAPIVEADEQLVTYIRTLNSDWPIEVGDPVRAVWVEEAVNLSQPGPQPPVGYLNGQQVAALVVAEVDEHDDNPDAHPAIRALIDSGSGGVAADLAAHTGDTTNPHQVSAEQVGLGQAANLAPADYPVSTAQQAAIEGAVDDLSTALAAVAHSGDAADILTGLLDDARIPATIARDSEVSTAVTAAIAELRGAAPAALDTFLEVAQRLADDADALAALTNQIAVKADQTALDAHTSRVDNPHGVTAAQVGLGNVANTAPADLPLSDAATTALAGKVDAATFVEAVQDVVGALAQPGTNIEVDYDDATGALTISAIGGSGGLDTEQVRDVVGTLLVEGAHIDIVVDDAANTITIAVTGLADVATTGAYADLTGTPVLADVATSGAYGDLAGAPAIPDSPDDVGAQPVDPDLTAIAALDSTTAGTVGSDGAGWIKKSWAQVKTALGLTKADVGLDQVANTAPADLPVSGATQTALDAKAPTSRTITAGTGLTGGGDLSANRTLAVSYGTAAGTAAQGNDARLADTRTPTDSSVTNAKVAPGAAIAESKLALASDAAAATPSRRTLGTGATQALPGNHASTTNARTPTAHKTSHATGGADALTPADIGAAPAPAATQTISYASSITPDASVATSGAVTATGAMTVNPPTGGRVGGGYVLAVTASGANRAVTLTGFTLAGATSPQTVTSGKTVMFPMVRLAGGWRALPAAPDA